MEIRASTTVEVSVEYRGLPLRDLDRAICLAATRLGGKGYGSGFYLPKALRDLSFGFKRPDRARAFLREVQRLSKAFPHKQDRPYFGLARRKKGQ